MISVGLVNLEQHLGAFRVHQVFIGAQDGVTGNGSISAQVGVVDKKPTITFKFRVKSQTQQSPFTPGSSQAREVQKRGGQHFARLKNFNFSALLHHKHSARAVSRVGKAQRLLETRRDPVEFSRPRYT